MTGCHPTGVDRALAASFSAFVFVSTFSIAISQLLLGLSLLLFLLQAVRSGFNPSSGPLRLFAWAILVWIGWLVVSSLMGETPLRSMWLAREEWLFCIIPIGVYLFRFERLRVLVPVALASGVLLISLYCFIIYSTGWAGLSSYDPVAAPGFGWRVAGTFSHRMTFGNYWAVATTSLIAFGLAASRALEFKWRVLIVIASLSGALATALSFGRGPIVVMAMATLIVLILVGRRYLVLSSAVVVTFVIAAFAIPGVTHRYSAELEKDVGGEYEGGRVFIWKNSLKVIEDHPVFGTGPGNFQEAYVGHLREDISVRRKLTHAHNDFLNVAATTGIPGLIIYLGVWAIPVFTFINTFFRRRRESSIELGLVAAALVGSICFLGVSMYEAAWVDEEVRAILMIVWSLGLAVWYNQAKEAALRG